MNQFKQYDIGETILKVNNITSQTQDNLFCKITSSLGDSDLFLHSLTGIEEISNLYIFTVNMFSKDGAIDSSSALGTNLSIEIKIGDSEPRYIHGIIAKFSQGITITEDDSTLTHYVAEIRPKLWILSLNRNYKIFQKMTAIDIINEVLSNGGVSDVENRVNSRGNAIKTFCVQYNESDFDFISRLMEEEGIFYFFTHDKNSHTMVLGDSSGAYKKIVGNNKITFAQAVYPNVLANTIYQAKVTNTYCPGGYATSDYNYTISKTDLFNSVSGVNSNSKIFDYPGKFEKSSDGSGISDMRIQMLERDEKVLLGKSTAANMALGGLFNLYNHPSFDDEYMICMIKHSISTDSTALYSNELAALASNKEFRPMIKTKKPKIYGTQTAIVTGPDGEEIYTDDFRRIKVHFYWDRDGVQDENSSCWIRVAQIWAGNTWGALYTPRIGQEVVINFENGDPDRPIVVGCVYNDQFMPPYTGEEATKSTIKSTSSKGEEGFNEIRFEDLKDEEEIYVHAQKDMNIDIINDRNTMIEEGSDTLTIIKGSRTELLNADGDNPGNYVTTLTKGDIVTTITEGNFKKTLNKGNRSVTIEEGDELITLKSGNSTIKLENGNMDLSVSGDYSITVGGNLSIKVSGNIDIKSDKNISIKSSMGITCESGTDSKFKAGTNFATEASVAYEAKGTTVAVKGAATLDVNCPMITIGGGIVQLG